MRIPFIKLMVGKFWNALQCRLNACALAQASECLRHRLGAVGPNAQLAPNLLVEFAERVQIGDWVYIGPGGQLLGRGGLTIADHVIIGPQVTIMTSMHNFKDARLIPYDEIESLKPVEIGVACWLGFGTILLPGVVLGKGCIVGAGAVVTKSFPDGSIVAGNPANIVGVRNMEQFSDHLANGRTYLKNKAFHKLEKVESVDNVRKYSSASQ
jgi:acetyltransferase-like isoleucine patch superfamily enzyme